MKVLVPKKKRKKNCQFNIQYTEILFMNKTRPKQKTVTGTRDSQNRRKPSY